MVFTNYFFLLSCLFGERKGEYNGRRDAIQLMDCSKFLTSSCLAVIQHFFVYVHGQKHFRYFWFFLSLFFLCIMMLSIFG